MEIPRGYAMAPMTHDMLYDFLFNYFKAEYSPIRSFFSTATAVPVQRSRWVAMGHELFPTDFRPANAQAQADLQTFEEFAHQKQLDWWFIRGLLIRFAKYDGHDRLERRLGESGRADLLVRKALKEKHLMDSIWPSPPRRGSENSELTKLGVQVRVWYGDMFSKYFLYLRAVDDFAFREDVATRIQQVGILNLVPYADHLSFGDCPPIDAIVMKGSGYRSQQERMPGLKADKLKDKNAGLGKGFGEPDRFEIRFNAPSTGFEETLTRSVVRQTECLKCGTRRDVTVVISLDPVTGTIGEAAVVPSPAMPDRPRNRDSNTSTRHRSKAAQRYSPGSVPPGENSSADRTSPIIAAASQRLHKARKSEDRPSSSPAVVQPVPQRQCQRCTFLNHAELSSCEMCGGELPDSTLVTIPPSPPAPSRAPKQDEHTEMPPTKPPRPTHQHTHSLSERLFSILPFPAALQQQQVPESRQKPEEAEQQRQKRTKKEHPEQDKEDQQAEPEHKEHQTERKKTRNAMPPGIIRQAEPSTQLSTSNPDSPWHDSPPASPQEERTSIEDSIPAILPLSSPPPRHMDGLPQHLMDDYVPTPAALHEEQEEQPGWGEVGRRDTGEDNSEEQEEEEEEEEERKRRTFQGLEDVGREEMGVWGDVE